MAISSFSAFYYGFRIDSSNRNIPFREGAGPELNAQIAVGSYSPTEFLIAVKTALDTIGTLTYTVTLDRTTRLVTISATGAFSLLKATGATRGASAFDLLGFTGVSDLTGASSYLSPSPAGTYYQPQFKLQDYVSPDEFQEFISPSINESASGAIEVINFGLRRFMECNLVYITDRAQSGELILNNPLGVSQALDFLRFATLKSPLEFVPDVATPSVFYKVILDSTPQSKEGVGFKLRELIGRGLPGYFETGVLRFRVF